MKEKEDYSIYRNEGLLESDEDEMNRGKSSILLEKYIRIRPIIEAKCK